MAVSKATPLGELLSPKIELFFCIFTESIKYNKLRIKQTNNKQEQENGIIFESHSLTRPEWQDPQNDRAH